MDDTRKVNGHDSSEVYYDLKQAPGKGHLDGPHHDDEPDDATPRGASGVGDERMPPSQVDRLMELWERRADEDRRLRQEEMKQLLAAVGAAGGAGSGSKRPSIVSLAALLVSLLGILGTAMVWIGNSGASVGVALNQQLETKKELDTEVSRREELQKRFDHLKDLYMIKYGVDPDVQDTTTLRGSRK